MPRSRTPSTDPSGPALVRLHVWGVPGRGVPLALARMSTGRLSLRSARGLEFSKLLGTGAGETFTPSDADWNHWALLTSWSDSAAADEFESSRMVRAWDNACFERLALDLSPLSSKGKWSRRTPFGDPKPTRWQGPIAAITRARVKASQWRAFWRAVPPVVESLHRSPGLLMRCGIGEAPVGLQGTLSVWQDDASLINFAHKDPAHLNAVKQTAAREWYAEELFARLAVISARGSFNGHSLAIGAKP